jgi:hypothetical protein
MDNQQQPPPQNDRRISPNSDIDLQLLVTNPVWGRKLELNEKVRQDLKKLYRRQVKPGDLIIKEGQIFEVESAGEMDDEANLWEQLNAIYTRDIRLGNLGKWSGEIDLVKYYLDLAGDFLQEGFMEPFSKALKLAITQIEVSQSAGGFLRNRMGTFTHESVNKDLGPPKRNLIGMQKDK